MRLVTPLDEVEAIQRKPERDEILSRFLTSETVDFLSARAAQDRLWGKLIRQYRGIPEQEWTKDLVPVRQIEVPIGAIACDQLFAQSWDMIFSANPLCVVRGNHGYEKHAGAVQLLLNHWAADPFTNLRGAAKDYMNDDVQLGTGILYTIWVEDRKKTGLETVVDRGPRIFCLPPDDLIVPGAAPADIQTHRMASLRDFLTEGELELRAKAGDWDISEFKECGQNQVSNVKRQRQAVSHTREPGDGLVKMYEVHTTYVYFDYDEDGFDEDLLVIWDRTSGKIAKLQYNPYDIRPFSICRYQYQPHSFYGIGPMEMSSPMQTEISDWHTFRMANARLVNSRAWGVKYGSPLAGEKLRITPNKPLYFQSADDLKEFKLADIYPSALQYEQADIQLAEKRVGTMTNFAARPMPGHRTPGMTMMAILQQINKRFAPAFDDMREGLANALFQCFIRMQEKYKLNQDGDKAFIEEYLNKILGPENAALILQLLSKETADLIDNLVVEMTASSQSINREADRQSSMMIMQVLGQYYEKMMQLAMVASNPQTPEPIKQMASKIGKASTEAMDTLLRTFDQIRDPSELLLTDGDFDGLSGSVTAFGGAEGISGPPQGPEAGASGNDAGMPGLGLSEPGQGPDSGSD